MSYTIPIGPYHPALEEPIHARLTVDGERITDAEVFVGYNHRGIERLAQERNFIQTLVLVERVCGICSHSHSLTYALCIEHIAGMEVPKRGQYIRVIIEELERIHSHLLWLGIACHIVGHDSLFMQCWNDREGTMDVLEALTGNRVNYGMNIIGGARRDFTDDQRRDLMAAMDDLEKRMGPITHWLTHDKTLAMRTKGVGVSVVWTSPFRLLLCKLKPSISPTKSPATLTLVPFASVASIVNPLTLHVCIFFV